MSLVISQQPQLYTPAYNSQVFTALSNQIAVADFKYIVTVQVNGGTIYTFNILPRQDGYLVYDPIEIVKNYITRNYFNPTSVVCSEAVGKSCSVEVKIKEYYTSAIQSTTTVNYTAYDACLKELDFKSYNYNNYVLNGLNVYLLQNSDQITSPSPFVDIKDDVWIHFFRNSTTNIYLQHFDGVTTTGINLAIPTSNNNIYYANVGYKTLLANGITIKGGDIVNITIENALDRFTSFYIVKDDCTNFDKYTIQYLKRNGNIARFNFNMLSTTNVSKQYNTVNLNPKRITSGVYGSNTWNAEKHTISMLTKKQMTLTTNWLTESQSEQLEELFDSPVKWLVDANHNYLSFTITDTSYKIDKHNVEPLFFYKLSLEFDINETRQRAI